MRFVHTSDWHIGKVVNEMSMIEDQIYVLDQLVAYLEESRPDALIIAGDLYDRSVAPAKAVEVLGQYLTQIIDDLGVPVLAIGGNHDSGERLDFGRILLKSRGLYLEGMPKKEVTFVDFEDAYGKVRFYLVPYIEPALARYLFEDETIRTHEEAMKKILSTLELKDAPKRKVLIAHGYVTYMEDETIESDSERPLSIGGTDKIHGSVFDAFNYVALGHLHGPQRVGSNRIRYSGSPLKYSFSEEKHHKSFTVITLEENGDIQHELIDLKPRHNMRTLTGTLEELCKKAEKEEGALEDYVFATLTDEVEVYEPLARLRSFYPNIMGVRRQFLFDVNKNHQGLNTSELNQSKVELFKSFYEDVTGSTFDSKREEILQDIVEIVEKEEVL